MRHRVRARSVKLKRTCEKSARDEVHYLEVGLTELQAGGKTFSRPRASTPRALNALSPSLR